VEKLLRLSFDHYSSKLRNAQAGCTCPCAERADKSV